MYSKHNYIFYLLIMVLIITSIQKNAAKYNFIIFYAFFPKSILVFQKWTKKNVQN